MDAIMLHNRGLLILSAQGETCRDGRRGSTQIDAWRKSSMSGIRRGGNDDGRRGRALTPRLVTAIAALALTAIAPGTGVSAGAWSVTRVTQVTGTSDLLMGCAWFW